MFRRKPDLVHQGKDLVAGILAIDQVMHNQRLTNDLADPHPRIE